MAVVFFHLITIQHQGHLNEFDFSSARQSTLSAGFCWFNKVSSPSQVCFQIMETVQREHALPNLHQTRNKLSLQNKSSKICVCITKSVPSQYKHTKNPEGEIKTLGAEFSFRNLGATFSFPAACQPRAAELGGFT